MVFWFTYRSISFGFWNKLHNHKSESISDRIAMASQNIERLWMISYGVAESLGWQRRKRSMGIKLLCGSGSRNILKYPHWVIDCSSSSSVARLAVTTWGLGWELFEIVGRLQWASWVQVDACVGSVDPRIGTTSCSCGLPNPESWSWLKESGLGTIFDPST